MCNTDHTKVAFWKILKITLCSYREPSLLRPPSPQSDSSSSAPITAWHGKLSILDTAITSWDESIGGPDERLEGRAYIAALSGQNADGSIVYTSRMDVEDSEISYLGNEGDYHNDIGALRWLPWCVLLAYCGLQLRKQRIQRGLGGSQHPVRSAWVVLYRTSIRSLLYSFFAEWSISSLRFFSDRSTLNLAGIAVPSLQQPSCSLLPVDACI